jgi:diacylglycerol kinase (ATP)
MNGLLVYNAAAGSASNFPAAQLLAELPPGTSLHQFVEGDDPAAIGRAAVEAGLPWVAVAGGDGTVEAVAGALVDSPVVLGVIPCGTYNNFARSAGLPRDPLAAARVIAAGASRPVDVGFVNGHPFFECVGIGLDAALFPLGEEIKSGGITKWFDLLLRARGYPRQHFELRLDRPLHEVLGPARRQHPVRQWIAHTCGSRRTTVRVRALMITVSNGPYYGMNFQVAPTARIDDGALTISIFKRYSKLELAWHFFSIRSGRRAYAPRLTILTVQHVKIRSSHPLPVHRDGELIDHWPIELSIRPQALQLFC